MLVGYKKVLVTGACGFIGSHLVERLIEEGCIVRAFVYYNSFNFWGWLDTLKKDNLKGIEIFTGDIRDPNGVRKAVEGVDAVFHLAALIGIPFSYHSPDSYVDTNIRGTLNVLQACKDFNVKKVVITSTSEVYGTAKYVPIDESHPLQPQSPYSATKIGADSIAESFFRAFDVPVIIARPFNTYGPRQSARAVIPSIITQLLRDKKEIKLGSLTPTRDLCFVRDTCEGFLTLANLDKAVGSVINIGTGTEISVGELANSLIKRINPEAKIISEHVRLRPQKSEVERLVCDNSLIKRLSGWSPKTSFDDGIEETIKWFRQSNNLAMYKDSIYNV